MMSSLNILDLTVVAIFVICAVVGLQKGLVKMFFGIASYILSGVAVIMFMTPVSQYMMQTQLPAMVTARVKPVIETAFKSANGTLTAEEALQSIGIPDFAVNFIEKSIDTEALANDFVQTLTASAVDGIIKVFSMLVIFIGVSIILSFILFSFGKLLRNPLLGSFNRMLGAVIGVANAMIGVYLLCAAVMLLSPFTDMSAITDVIEKTFITKCFYNNNVLMNIFC